MRNEEFGMPPIRLHVVILTEHPKDASGGICEKCKSAMLHCP